MRCRIATCLSLLAYSIGKAQELLAMLRGSGLKVVMHGAVFKMSKVYEAFGLGVWGIRGV